MSATASASSATATIVAQGKGTWWQANQSSVWLGVGRIGVIVVFLAVWELASGRWLPENVISSPIAVITRCVELVASGEIWEHFVATGIEFVLGFVLGVAAGLVVGLLLGAWPIAGKLLEPLLSALNGIPKIALAPILIIWLGIDMQSKIGIAAMTVFFVMFYNVYIGMRGVPSELVNAMKIFGANRLTINRVVVLPHLTPTILAGLRAGIPFAIIGVIVGEFLVSTEGLGYYIKVANNSLDATGVLAGIAFLMVLIFAMGIPVTLWERYATKWQR